MQESRVRARPAHVLPLLLLLLPGAPAAHGLRAGPPLGPLPAGGRPVDLPALRNVARVSERLYSGGVPEGEEGFRALRRLGIRTVISVDGARPDAEAARRNGMRTVHIPFGYDGVPAAAAGALVRAVRDLPGPVYLHCHYGRHRSPAGAALARIALDGIPNEQAVREMERAGTGRNYTGLYADVRNYRPPAKEELDRLKVVFRESVPPPPLVEAMVRLEARFDRLARLQRAGWREPGADAAYQALQLRELYAELGRAEETRRRPDDYRQWVADGERGGRELEAALRAASLPRASAALGRLAAGCGACHAKYRDVPGGPRDR